MTDLMPLGGAQPLTMSSREIADLCETRHNQVVETIQRLMGSGVLRDSRKTPRRVQPEGGGRPMEVYDLTKRDTLVVISGYRDDIRARIIDRWMELEAEKQAAQTFDPATILESPAAMRGLLLTYTEKVIALEAEKEAMREDVEAHERLVKADGSLSITEAAKNLGMRPKDLFSWLAQNGWIYRRPNAAAWLGYQSKCNAGLLEHKSTTVLRADGSEKITEQCRVTAKGMSKLARLIPPGPTLVA